MSTTDVTTHPWLPPEQSLIRDSLARKIPILGICLGAQQIAAALGARIYPNHCREIGWFPVEQLPNTSRALSQLPRCFTAFHWHGDTFELPSGATPLAKSDQCFHQAFEYGSALGLQFHLESTRQSIRLLTESCAHEFRQTEEFVQSPEYMLRQDHPFQQLSRHLTAVLDSLSGMGTQ